MQRDAKVKRYIERIVNLKQLFGIENSSRECDLVRKANVSSSMYDYIRARRISYRNSLESVNNFGNGRKKNSLSNRCQDDDFSSFLSLPIDVMFHVFELLTPLDWMNLEKSCRQLKQMTIGKCKDVIEIDTFEDYISSKSKKKYRTKQRIFPEVVKFVGNRFTSLENVILNGCNFDVKNPNVISVLGLALPDLKRIEFICEWPKYSCPTVRKRVLNGFNKNFAKLESLLLDGSIIRDNHDKK